MSQQQILIHEMSYFLPNATPLFTELSLTFAACKTGLVGRNGIGKSTLLKLIQAELTAFAGAIQIDGTIAYVPQSQQFTQHTSVAEVLGGKEKLTALHKILNGSVDASDFSLVGEDWNVAEKIQQQLMQFGLEHIPFDRDINLLSGGEMTRLLLCKAFNSHADFILLDEPTNHLDRSGRTQLYQAINNWPGGLIVVSHDRSLLNLMDEIVELTTLGANRYGGNYDHYVVQKEISQQAHAHDLLDAKKLMQNTKHTIQSSREKHAQKCAYGIKLKESGSIDKMAAGAKRGRSERTQSKLLIKEERMRQQAETLLKSAKDQIEILDEIHVSLPKTEVPQGKIILEIEKLTFSYSNQQVPIIQNLNFKLCGPNRVAVIGDNGSGKTTLIKLILGDLTARAGKIYLGTSHINYLDQNCNLLNHELTVLDNFLTLNPDSNLNDAHRHLASFLFKNITTKKLVKDLSGGEKLRALLACILMSTQPPQLLILDEPTNHLDLSSIKIIESILKNYQGAMLIISHDQVFLDAIGVDGIIAAPFIA